MKTMRKGAIVKYCGSRKDFIETWGELFEVYHKEGNFLKLISLKSLILMYVQVYYAKIVY